MDSFVVLEYYCPNKVNMTSADFCATIETTVESVHSHRLCTWSGRQSSCRCCFEASSKDGMSKQRKRKDVSIYISSANWQLIYSIECSRYARRKSFTMSFQAAIVIMAGSVHLLVDDGLSATWYLSRVAYSRVNVSSNVRAQSLIGTLLMAFFFAMCSWMHTKRISHRLMCLILDGAAFSTLRSKHLWKCAVLHEKSR